MDYWKKQNIDNFIFELEKYYSDCSAEYFTGQGLVEKLSKEEIEYLNEKLNLSKIVGVESKSVLNEILKYRSKDKFTCFILRATNIKLEVNSINETGETSFMLLSKNYFSENNGFLIYIMRRLFERDYIIKNQDETFVTRLYQKKESEIELENWVLLRFAVKLRVKEKILLAFEKAHILFVILSLKLNKPIHFNFPNLLGVLNNAFSSNSYKENGNLLLKAIDVYDRTNLIQELDLRKGIFKKKSNDYKQNTPIQNKEFEEIIIALFPELG
jgi:hypothetical protein